MAAQDALLTPEQVAERLQVARFTVLKWMREGTLPHAIKVGSVWRLKASDLEAYLEAQRAKARPGQDPLGPVDDELEETDRP